MKGWVKVGALVGLLVAMVGMLVAAPTHNVVVFDMAGRIHEEIYDTRLVEQPETKAYYRVVFTHVFPWNGKMFMLLLVKGWPIVHVVPLGDYWMLMFEAS